MPNRHRHAETPLQFPSAAQALRGFGRAFRLRCPHCGRGHVLTTDDNYWGGAMVFGFLMGGVIFALSFLITLIVTWPTPPWDTLQYAPIGMLLLMAFVVPFSRVLWLTVDTLVQPVVQEELHD